jgi:hypothetical protein
MLYPSYRLWVDSNENHLHRSLALEIIETAILENVSDADFNRFCSCGCALTGVA